MNDGFRMMRVNFLPGESQGEAQGQGHRKVHGGNNSYLHRNLAVPGWHYFEETIA